MGLDVNLIRSENPHPGATRLIGQRLLHYEITEKLGAGGMGVVYKARDTHLDRFVAIKLLPPESIADPARRARFVHEAKAASALNHPNIVVVHDIASEAGADFIVMEYIAGKTLDQLIGREGMRLGEALKIAIQVAGAMARAHQAGIVHRDLKPSNVMVDELGAIKIVDFGLAKLTEAVETNEDAPTRGLTKTEEGKIVGTVAYMSPEQAAGQKVDARSDIFSFGSVLYEMVTGRRAFEGKSAVSTLAAILEGEPKPLEGAPCGLSRIIGQCLKKDPARRFQHMDDIRVELEELAEAPAAELPVRQRRWSRAAAVAAAVLLAAVSVGFTLWRLTRKEAAAGKPVRFTISVPQASLSPEIGLSPDGRYLVYSAVAEGRRKLFRRSMDRIEAEPIASTEGASAPRFSPDSKSVLFVSDQKVRRVNLEGGEAQTLFDLSALDAGFGGAVVAPDESLLYTRAVGGGLARSSGMGVAPQAITTVKKESSELAHAFPQLLPAGKGILFTIIQPGIGVGSHRAAVLAPGAVTHRMILDDAYAARYSTSGQLLFRRGATLYAVPFDLRRLAPTGVPAVIAEDLEWVLPLSISYSLSENGTLAYVKRDPEASRTVPCWVDRKGTAQPIPATAGYHFPALSPDGRRLALTRSEANRVEIWVWDFAREALSKVSLPGNNHAAIWTPDGARLVFSSDMEGPQSNLWWVRADGSGPPERLAKSDGHQDPGSLSPDGKFLVYAEVNAAGQHIWMLRLTEGRRAESLIRDRFNEDTPVISPDGKWLAYTSNESGRREVYVQPFPGGGAREQISTDGGDEALWRPDGREIYYRNGDEVMAASIEAGDRFSTQKPRRLFTWASVPRPGIGHPFWGISPDGKRFIMLKPPEQRKPREIQIVLNWFEELRHEPPAKKNP